MPTAIMKSCNSYFYWVAHRLGYDAIAPTANRLRSPGPFASSVLSLAGVLGACAACP